MDWARVIKGVTDPTYTSTTVTVVTRALDDDIHILASEKELDGDMFEGMEKTDFKESDVEPVFESHR